MPGPSDLRRAGPGRAWTASAGPNAAIRSQHLLFGVGTVDVHERGRQVERLDDDVVLGPGGVDALEAAGDAAQLGGEIGDETVDGLGAGRPWRHRVCQRGGTLATCRVET